MPDDLATPDVTAMVAWLREQIDEDERVAQAAVRDGGPDWSAGSAWLQEMIDPLPSTRRERPGWTPVLSQADAEHIARHDPARVLREVEAKRRIIDHIASRLDDGEEDQRWEGADAETDGMASTVLDLLTLPYADRPGFREEWRP